MDTDNKIWLKESDESGTSAFYGISNDTQAPIIKAANEALQNTTDILTTIKEKVIKAATDTATSADRKALQQELEHLIQELDHDRVADRNTIQKEINVSLQQIDDDALLTFNGKALVGGAKNSIAFDDIAFTSPLSQIVIHDRFTGQDMNIEELEIEALYEDARLNLLGSNAKGIDAGGSSALNDASGSSVFIDTSSSSVFANTSNKPSASGVSVYDEIQPEQTAAWFGAVQQYNSKVGSVLLGLITLENDFLL